MKQVAKTYNHFLSRKQDDRPNLDYGPHNHRLRDEAKGT